MGRYCKICGRERPNEKFSGTGHKVRVCKDCSRLEPAERERVEIAEELRGFVEQSRISEKNKKRLHELSAHGDPDIEMLADLVIRVARIAEGKRRRWNKVKESDYSLYLRCEEAGLVIERF